MESPVTGHQKTILLAVDDSRFSKTATNYVIHMVCAPEDRLLLFYASPSFPIVYPGIGSDFLVPPDEWRRFHTESKKEGERVLKIHEDMCKEAKVIYEAYSLEGDPRDLILSEANKKKVDIVVVGSRGHGAIKRAFLGSVSGYVVSHAKLPVLVVRGERGNVDASQKKQTRTILFAVDESEASHESVKWGLKNVCFKDDKIVLMTVQTLPVWAAYSEFTSSAAEEELERGLLNEKKRFLRKLNEEAKRFGKECSLDIIRGDAREAVVWAVERHEADLLVLGSRGLSPLSKVFLGSVSAYCVNNANCPVLVVYPEKEDASSPKQEETKEESEEGIKVK